MNRPALDLIAIGRCSVDHQGQQVGGRREGVATFSKAVGGCPANITIGPARLGLHIPRVGGEHIERFIGEHLVREGVDVVNSFARLKQAGDPAVSSVRQTGAGGQCR
jgi:5-dehydro-2-deoxygluconokinase